MIIERTDWPLSLGEEDGDVIALLRPFPQPAAHLAGRWSIMSGASVSATGAFLPVPPHAGHVSWRSAHAGACRCRTPGTVFSALATETLLRRSSRYIRLTRRWPVVADVFASTSGPTRAAFCSAPSLNRGVAHSLPGLRF